MDTFFQKEMFKKDLLLIGKFRTFLNSVIPISDMGIVMNAPIICGYSSPRNYRGKYSDGTKLDAIYAGDRTTVISKPTGIFEGMIRVNTTASIAKEKTHQSMYKLNIAGDAFQVVDATHSVVQKYILAQLKAADIIPQNIPVDVAEKKKYVKVLETLNKLVALGCVPIWRAKGVLFSSNKTKDAESKQEKTVRSRNTAPQMWDLANMPVVISKNLPKGAQGPGTLYKSAIEMKTAGTKQGNEKVYKKIGNCLSSQLGREVADLLLGETKREVKYTTGLRLIANAIAATGHKWTPIQSVPLYVFQGISAKDAQGKTRPPDYYDYKTLVKHWKATKATTGLPTVKFIDPAKFTEILAACGIGVIYSPMNIIEECVPDLDYRKEELDWEKKNGMTDDQQPSIDGYPYVPRSERATTDGTGGQKVGWNSNTAGANTTMEYHERAVKSMERLMEGGSVTDKERIQKQKERLADKRFMIWDLDDNKPYEEEGDWSTFWLTTTEISRQKYLKRKADEAAIVNMEN